MITQWLFHSYLILSLRGAVSDWNTITARIWNYCSIASVAKRFRSSFVATYTYITEFVTSSEARFEHNWVMLKTLRRYAEVLAGSRNSCVVAAELPESHTCCVVLLLTILKAKPPKSRHHTMKNCVSTAHFPQRGVIPPWGQTASTLVWVVCWIRINCFWRHSSTKIWPGMSRICD